MYNACFLFESGHFIIILFGYFPGYSYVKQVMENMNIEGGEACDGYIESLSAKQLQDKERKSKKKFKQQRRKLLLVCRAKSKQREKREGMTYGSGIASELGELQDEVCDIIKNVTKADAERSAKDASLPAIRAPPQLAGKTSTKLHHRIFWFGDFKSCQGLQNCTNSSSVQAIKLRKIYYTINWHCSQCYRSPRLTRRIRSKRKQMNRIIFIKFFSLCLPLPELPLSS